MDTGLWVCIMAITGAGPGTLSGSLLSWPHHHSDIPFGIFCRCWVFFEISGKSFFCKCHLNQRCHIIKIQTNVTATYAGPKKQNHIQVLEGWRRHQCIITTTNMLETTFKGVYPHQECNRRRGGRKSEFHRNTPANQYKSHNAYTIAFSPPHNTQLDTDRKDELLTSYQFHRMQSSCLSVLHSCVEC